MLLSPGGSEFEAPGHPGKTSHDGDGREVDGDTGGGGDDPPEDAADLVTVDTHTFRAAWDAAEIRICLNSDHLKTFGYEGRVSPQQHVFIGTDNVYTAQVGPIYSNLCVTQSL